MYFCKVKTMNTLQQLIEILHRKDCSLVVSHCGEVTTYSQKGVRDLIWLLDHEPWRLSGALVADKVVGKASAALMVLGWDVESVNCRVDHITNAEVDDGFQLDLRLHSGARAYIEVGTYNFIAMPRFYMRGRKGTAMITDWREETKVVRCKHWHESEVLPVQTAAGLTKTMAPRDEVTVDTYTIPRPTSDIHDYYRNIAAAIDGRATQLVTHEQMRIDLRVILCALRSAETGETIRF